MRITIPILTLCKGGAQRMLAELTNGLVRKGHHVTILMPQQGDIEYEVLGEVVRTSLPYKILESDYPMGDVIISNYYSLVSTAQIASENGKGVHIRLSMCYEPTFLPNNEVAFRTYHMPNLLVLSKWQQQIIYLNHGVKGSIVPVGISSIFKNLNIRDDHQSIQVSAVVRIPEGGYSWHREQEYLIEQLTLVKKHFPHVIVNLLCPPKEMEMSPTLQQLKNNGMFRYFTPADDIELCYHYNHTDIFVNSSTYDTASLPSLEAMKCGAALVTTYAGGNLDYCRHEENGLMSFFYEKRLFQDIARLIINPELRQKLAMAGEQEATKWTWDRSVSSFEQAVNKIVSGEKNG